MIIIIMTDSGPEKKFSVLLYLKTLLMITIIYNIKFCKTFLCGIAGKSLLAKVIK